MNRGHWKQYSSWEPEHKATRKRDADDDDGGFSGEVQVKKGYSWSEQIGIAVAALVEDGKSELAEWVKDVSRHILPRSRHKADGRLSWVQILVLVIRQRQQIVDATDQNSPDEDADEMEDSPPKDASPSKDANAKFSDYGGYSHPWNA